MSLKILTSLVLVTALVGSSLVLGINYSYGDDSRTDSDFESSYGISYNEMYEKGNRSAYGSTSVGGWQITYSDDRQSGYYGDKSYNEDYVPSNYNKMQWVITHSSAESKTSSSYMYPGQVYKNIGGRTAYSSYEEPRSSSYNY